ncbi:MAG TPA: hypothetical protein PLP25_02030 [Candidatus Limiplasma sp.]|nr:hypothetical protein [Candidatus Limiplasma sp.]HPS80625.1 hypothetical protein [Candidatus Limiplasma sp.]
MNGISVSPVVLLINGIPECLLVAWAMYIFTGTPLHAKKYLILSGVYAVATYLIRFLPITLGINTVLFLFVLIFSFQILHQSSLSKLVRSIISSVVILILIAVSEVCNVLLLTAFYGREAAETLFTSPNGLTRAVYSSPSNLFLGLFVLGSYFLMKLIQKKKDEKNGKVSEETSK